MSALKGVARSRGFTLIEVLIAIGVMAMISTLIMMAFTSLKNSKDGVQRVSERYREGRNALTRVSRELQSAYISRHLPINLALATTKPAFIAEPGSPADRVNFIAFVNRRLDRDAHESDQAEISYFGIADEKQRGVVDLVRRHNHRLDLEPDRGGRVQVLASDIDLFDLSYLDPLTSMWTERWDSTQLMGQFERLPLQVRITLILNGGSRVASGRANSTITFSTKISLPIQQPLSFALQ